MNNENDLIKVLIKHLPKENITSELIKDLGVDLNDRGEYFVSRCFVSDKTGELEMSLSNKFSALVKHDDFPEYLAKYTEDEKSLKAMATLWQWLGTNVGRGNLADSYSDAGWYLSWGDSKK